MGVNNEVSYFHLCIVGLVCPRRTADVCARVYIWAIWDDELCRLVYGGRIEGIQEEGVLLFASGRKDLGNGTSRGSKLISDFDGD